MPSVCKVKDGDSKDKDDRTPLSFTANSGYEVVVRQLLDTGKVDVNQE
jgi:hypothetical protein